ncbi:MAG: protein kinase [Deltaproteobacteria bacterium]|nr:protein kinase [Deltaproteobacteria bacterium]
MVGRSTSDALERLRESGTLAGDSLFAGRYRLEDCLGQGAMGIVYRARDCDLGEAVALKLLSVEPNQDAVERFRREVRLARRVTSRHVARIHDIGEADGFHFLTMELVLGESLEERLARAPMSFEDAARIAAEIAYGLDAAHAEQVVHRDLKPANVLLDAAEGRADRAVLTDFGIARALTESMATHPSGTLLGTPAYMAPEQVLGERVDARTDLYALGLNLYEMLTGEVPFLDPNQGVIAVALARCHRSPEDPRRHRAVPEELAALVMRCLERDPTRRPPTARGVAESLEGWLARDAQPSLGSSDTLTVASATVLALQASAASPPTSGPSSVAARGGVRSLRPFEALPALERSLAVLPFRVRGADADDLGVVLQEELIDVLSRTRGLRIASSNVAERFRDERDPRAVGSILGVDSVIDGTVQRLAERIRVTVRLLDAASGAQTWSARHEVPLSEALALEETLAARIAEALRLEIGAERAGESAPTEAVELYLAARREMRGGDFANWRLAVEQLDRALAIAPDFRLALAAHAMSLVRGWWASGSSERDWASEVEASVARAVLSAPGLAETRLASAMLAIQRGDLVHGAAELGRALAIAPTFAEAHVYLGELQCEAGQVSEGMRRLKFALELHPETWRPHANLARVCALRGEHEAAGRHLAEVERLRGDRGIVRLSLAIRIAVWRRDHARVRELVDLHASDADPVVQGLIAYGRVVLGEADSLEGFRQASRATGNRRMMSLVDQLAAEAYGSRGDDARCLACLRAAAEVALVDVEWLERCTTLATVRQAPEFAAVRSRVQLRAASVWGLP